MALQWRILPVFPENGNQPLPAGRSVSNYYRSWIIAVSLILSVALLPLAAAVYFDYRGAKHSSEQELLSLADRHLFLAQETLSVFLAERSRVVQFVAQENSFDQLSDPDQLASLFDVLNGSMGGFVGLALVDATGTQICSAGLDDNDGRQYGQALWFREAVGAGTFVGSVEPGVSGRKPRVTIAAKQEISDTSFFIVRATLEGEALLERLHSVGEKYFEDLFLMDHHGVLQTPSLFHGEVLESLPLPLSPDTAVNQSLLTEDHHGQKIILAYTALANTSFIFVGIVTIEELHHSWSSIRWQRIIFFLGSCLLVFLIVAWVVTNLVEATYRADRQSRMAMQDAVHVDKLASIGRLTAGVAHEINNPLAIIKEKAGFLGDLLTHHFSNDTTVEKMSGLVEAIDRAVNRCTEITHRVLDFSRPDIKTKQVIDPAAMIKEVLGFFEKDTKRRGIMTQVHVDADLPSFVSERGKLQQIFLNLISNAFDALDENGHLDVTISRKDLHHIQIIVCDDGHGIAADDLNRVFEPFFSTKIHTGGTGLGLFITNELINELHGQIQVESTPGVGTTFFLTLPTGN